MPGFERTRRAAAAMNERTRDAAQTNVPGQNIKNQLSGKVLPTTGNTGSGYTPATHAASHEDGGADALDLPNLAGVLIDAQIPNLDTAKLTSGILPVARGGTGVAVRPSFSVHKNGTNQTVAQTIYTKVTWPTEATDTNNNFASDKFTPTVAGTYLLLVGIYWLSVQASQQYYTVIYKNGALHRSDFRTMPTAFNGFVSLTALVQANGSTDYFEVYVYHSSSASIAIYGDSTASTFSGIWIGP